MTRTVDCRWCGQQTPDLRTHVAICPLRPVNDTAVRNLPPQNTAAPGSTPGTGS